MIPDGITRDDPNGDYDFENSLGPALGKMAAFQGVNLAFGYYADSPEFPNAAFDENAPLKPLNPNLPSDGTIPARTSS